MKKIFLLTAAILILISCSAFAAKDFSRTVGVVVIGGAEFKTPDYYKYIKNAFSPKSGANLEVGGDLQNKYQKFLLNNDLVGSDTPRRQDFIDFTASSGRGKILFIVIDSTIDHQNNAMARQKDRISVQVDGYLCSSTSIIDAATTSQQSDSKTSDLRARRSAFKKCLEDLANSLNGAM